MPITAFDPANDPHSWGALICSQVADGVNIERPEGRRLLRRMFQAGARCAVWFTEAEPWTVVGFAIVMPDSQVVCWCWTRPSNRGNPKQGRASQYVMTDLLIWLGCEPLDPITALFRSPAGEGIQRRGVFKIRFADEPTPSNDNSESPNV